MIYIRKSTPFSTSNAGKRVNTIYLRALEMDQDEEWALPPGQVWVRRCADHMLYEYDLGSSYFNKHFEELRRR